MGERACYMTIILPIATLHIAQKSNTVDTAPFWLD
jgi:hypothetical protein